MDSVHAYRSDFPQHASKGAHARWYGVEYDGPTFRERFEDRHDLPKSSFDQEDLLETIRNLLGEP